MLSTNLWLKPHSPNFLASRTQSPPWITNRLIANLFADSKQHILTYPLTFIFHLSGWSDHSHQSAKKRQKLTNFHYNETFKTLRVSYERESRRVEKRRGTTHQWIVFWHLQGWGTVWQLSGPDRRRGSPQLYCWALPVRAGSPLSPALQRNTITKCHYTHTYI